MARMDYLANVSVNVALVRLCQDCGDLVRHRQARSLKNPVRGSLAPNWRSESVTSRLPPVSLSVPRTCWRRSCVDQHPESWWQLCGVGGGGPAVPRSAGRLLLPGGGCLRVSRPQLCRCHPGGWRCRVATSSSRTHRKLTLGVQTVLVFSTVSPAEVYISTLQLFGLFSSMIFPAEEARERDRLLVYDGEA